MSNSNDNSSSQAPPPENWEDQADIPSQQPLHYQNQQPSNGYNIPANMNLPSTAYYQQQRYAEQQPYYQNQDYYASQIYGAYPVQQQGYTPAYPAANYNQQQYDRTYYQGQAYEALPHHSGGGGYNKRGGGVGNRQWQPRNQYSQQPESVNYDSYNSQQQEDETKKMTFEQYQQQGPGNTNSTISTSTTPIKQTGPAKSVSLGSSNATSKASVVSLGGGKANVSSLGKTQSASSTENGKDTKVQQPTPTASTVKPISAVVAESEDPSKSLSTSTMIHTSESATESKPATPPAKKKSSLEESGKKTAPPPVTSTTGPETLQEDEEQREHINIVFIGHVDAGKSTMAGHILYLTGMVDKRTLEKYEREAKELGRESWYLSWAMDLTSEEREKGKTVDYGRGYFETDRRRFTLLDAPGHKTFVPSMLGGAAQADVAVLVISARKGEFEAGFDKEGQTREHARLAKTVGVKRLVIVINKMDDPSVQWSQERYDECLGKLIPFLKSVGFNPKKDLDILPISGFTGANIKDRLPEGTAPFYSGPSLLELLDNMEIPRDFTGPLRMPIADRFKDMGTVVVGKIESGRLVKGQQVILMPNKKQCEIMAIMSEDKEMNSAKNGDNVRIRLKNVEEDDVMPGFVLCTINNPVHNITAFEAQLQIVESKSIICGGYQAVMHSGAITEEITLTDLKHMIDKASAKKSKHAPKFVRTGDICIARIETSQIICLETYKDYPQLGRFTLRDEGKTVAIGKVTKLLFDETATAASE